ncbi:MAG: TetR/AcrR family transcriptional regulator [Desulfovibrionaceae bacterium]|nr:TetR/AcrR family transcriptional regulator [Desulfovibrionaceae bacterium]
MSAREDRKQDRRREILRVAGELFLREGYAGTTMAGLMRELGGSKATVYSYFHGKEDIFRSYIEQRIEEEAENVFAFPGQDTPPEEALTRFGLRFMRMVMREDSRALNRLLVTESMRFPEIGQTFYTLCIEFGRSRLMDYLKGLDARGLVRIDSIPRASEQFIALCKLDSVLRLMVGVREELDAAELEEQVRAAVAVFMAAYGTGRKA